MTPLYSCLNVLQLTYITFYYLFKVLEDPLSEGIKSTLIIRESRQEHFGVYNCTVSNQYGSDVVEITLKAQSMNFLITFIF